MPVIDGKVRRSRFTSLKIGELSAVDNPAQPGATMAIMKAYNPDQPRDPAGTPTGGRWTSTHSSGGRGPSALPEGVEEYGFIPTVVTAQQGDDEDYSQANERLETGALAAYDEVHSRLKAKLSLTDNEVHAILTSRHGRHMADDFVGGGPGVRGDVQGLVQTWTSRGYVEPLLRTAAAYSAGEGEWPIALEQARTGKRVDSSENADKELSLKRLAKYVCEGDGAHTFSEVLRENKFSQEVWPCVDALSQSIRSIVGDDALTGGEREAKINASVEQFLQAVRDIAPEVSKQLSELCSKREGQMPKTPEELQAELTKVEGQLADATKRADTEKTRADTAESELTALKAKVDEPTKELAAVKTELETTKAKLAEATEETIKVGNTEIKKSVVGPEQFAMAKALADERDTAKLEKRAESDFRHVVGTATEKAAVLRLVDGLPADNPTRKAVEAIMTSAEKMAANAFDTLGAGGGPTPTQKAAQATFDQKVDEIMKRDDLPRHRAMSKARGDFPAEYEAAYGNGSSEPAVAS